MSSWTTQPRARALLAALAPVAVAVLILAWAAESHAKPPREFYGVVPQTQPSAHDFELMQRDRVGIVRQLFFWPDVQPGPGAYNWGQLDEVVRRAVAARIRVFPVLYGTPAWAQSARRDRKCGPACGPGKSARDDFAAFARAAAARYGPGGDFWVDSCECADPMPIRAWQVWTEQNSPKYFGPRPSVRKYARLFQAAAAKIRSEDRGAEVITGGMWGPPGADAVVPTTRYLRNLYRVRGMRRAIDSVAVHPYASRFGRVKSQLQGIRSQLKRSGDARAGLWVTELGWASGGSKRNGLVKSKREQARLLRKSYRLLLRKRRAWKVRSAHWYSWRDIKGRAICEWCPKSGLRTKSGAAKPAARAFRRLPRR